MLVSALLLLCVSASAVTLESLDGSRCYGMSCADPGLGNPQSFPSNLPLYKEFPLQVRLASPVGSSTTLQLSVAPPNSGGCEFSTNRAYPAGHPYNGLENPASRPLDNRLQVNDDSYELSHDYKTIDASSSYSATLNVQVQSGQSVSSPAFIRCNQLNSTGSPIRVTGPGVSYASDPIAVLSPCRYPSLVGELQSGHCTEHCAVRTGSLSFQVELGRRVEFQDVSIENRGSCCGRGDTLPQVHVAVGSAWVSSPTHSTAASSQSNTTGDEDCGGRRDIQGPSAIPVDQMERFGPQGQDVEASPADGPIRKLHVVGANTDPVNGPNQQQTRVFFCNRKVGRFIKVTTAAPSSSAQYMMCEVQLKVNYFSPDHGYTDGNVGTTSGRLQSIDVKVFPEMWSTQPHTAVKTTLNQVSYKDKYSAQAGVRT